MRVGYCLSSEEYSPSELLLQARLDEQSPPYRSALIKS